MVSIVNYPSTLYGPYTVYKIDRISVVLWKRDSCISLKCANSDICDIYLSSHDFRKQDIKSMIILAHLRSSDY